MDSKPSAPAPAEARSKAAQFLLNPRAHNGTPPSSAAGLNPTSISQSEQPEYAGALTSSPADLDIAFLGQLPTGRKRPSSLNGEIPPVIPAYPPRVLLDPRSPKKNATSHGTEIQPSGADQIKLIGTNGRPRGASDSSPYINGQENRTEGIGNLIDRVHGVSTREARPQKRQKTGSEMNPEDKVKVTKHGPVPGNGGGVIGEYMHQKKEEGKLESARNQPIDLTAVDDDDDDLVVLSDSAQKEVCYGKVEGKLQAHLVPHPKATATFDQGIWPSIMCALSRGPKNTHIITASDALGNDFATISPPLAHVLAILMDSRHIGLRTQPRMSARKRHGQEPAAGQATSQSYDVSINLYGRKAAAMQVGNFLKSKQIFLRSPTLVDKGFETVNPHQGLKLPENRPVTNAMVANPANVGGSYVVRTLEEVNNDVIGMFDSLEKTETMPEMEASPLVVTQLLKHQKQALCFMTVKEKEQNFEQNAEDTKSLWRLRFRDNGNKYYQNIISGTIERSKPAEVRGGILADMMGLGKTLSILSLIVSTIGESNTWAKKKPLKQAAVGDLPLLRNSKATLLVCPLSTLANWEEQIAAHLQKGSISYYVYHGPNRTDDIEALSRFDVVITTYHIMGSELERKSKKLRGGAVSPLMQTNWFRIVLDEAHIIRQAATNQSKAACSVVAQRRWAVTGTPIQNSLSDLAALIKFLRIKPFDDRGGFANSFIGPLKLADPQALPKLQLLVRSITLRRLKDRIDLPPRHDQLVKLPFSEDEQQLYDYFVKDSVSRVNVVAAEGQASLGGKAYVHVLRAILRLRLICAHGKELLGEEDLKLMEGASKTNAIEVEDVEEEKVGLNPRQAYDMFNLMRDTDADFCIMCRARVGLRDPTPEDSSSDEEQTLAYMTPCFHLLCKNCIPKFKDEMQDTTMGEAAVACPVCFAVAPMVYFEITKQQSEEDVDARLAAKEGPKGTKKLGAYAGPHTKTQTLIKYLVESQAWGTEHPDERPLKSVVFSGWTSHLDLIEFALDKHKIRYTRLDGRMRRAQRNEALKTFREDDSVPVILVSISAGGLGLNLTTGSRVYVMEPQFNPAAEAQAIDRVHRLGQTREVTTIRFIMAESFEEKMLELQHKKQNLAELGLGQGKLDKSESMQKKLQDLRSLFK